MEEDMAHIGSVVAVAAVADSYKRKNERFSKGYFFFYRAKSVMTPKLQASSMGAATNPE